MTRKYIGIIFVLLLFSETLFGVRYLNKDRKGNRYFQCNRSCGEVRVKKISSRSYRVMSIPFSGVVKARSEENAAEKACGEDILNGSYQNSPSPSRKGGACN